MQLFIDIGLEIAGRKFGIDPTWDPPRGGRSRGSHYNCIITLYM